jgi:hypothetical protein
MGKGFKTLLTVFKESRKKSSSVQAALQSSTWLQDLDIHGHITVQLVKELVALWLALQEVQLMPGVDDEITWNWRTIDGRFTTASAYKVQFLGSSQVTFKTLCFGSPGLRQNANFLHGNNRVWTSDRLAQQGWTHSPSCPLCHFTMDTSWWLAGTQDTFG